MKNPIWTALGIVFNIAMTIFLVLSLFGFVPSLSPDNRRILIIIIAGLWTIQVLKSASKMDEKKDKN